jgi:hypothetical protein
MCSIGHTPFETDSGLQGLVLEAEVLSSRLMRFMYVHGGLGLNLAYLVPESQLEELRPLIEFTFTPGCLARPPAVS